MHHVVVHYTTPDFTVSHSEKRESSKTHRMRGFSPKLTWFYKIITTTVRCSNKSWMTYTLYYFGNLPALTTNSAFKMVVGRRRPLKSSVNTCVYILNWSWTPYEFYTMSYSLVFSVPPFWISGRRWRRAVALTFSYKVILFLPNSNFVLWGPFLKTPEQFSGPKSVFKIPFVSVGGAVLWKLV